MLREHLSKCSMYICVLPVSNCSQYDHTMAASKSTERFKLIFYAPPQSLPDLKAAIFATGAGTHGEYTECCFTTPGIGQFRPSNAARPALGEAGKLEEAGEVRCELQCSNRSIAHVAVEALKKSVQVLRGKTDCKLIDAERIHTKSRCMRCISSRPCSG